METAQGLAWANREILRGNQIKAIGFGYGYKESTRPSEYRHTGQIVLWRCLYKGVGEVLKDRQQKVVTEWPPEGKLNYFLEWSCVIFLAKNYIYSWAELVCVHSYRGGFRGLIPCI